MELDPPEVYGAEVNETLYENIAYIATVRCLHISMIHPPQSRGLADVIIKVERYAKTRELVSKGLHIQSPRKASNVCVLNST